MKAIIIYVWLLFVIAQADAQVWSHMGPFSQSGSLFRTGRVSVIRTDPAYDGSTNTTIYAGSVMGGFWKTTNDGVSWQNIHPDPSVVKYGGVSAMAIVPAGNLMYVADINFQYGSSGIYKYDPILLTWATTGSLPGATQLGLTVHDIRIHPANSNYIFACTNQGLFRSTNGGSSWSNVLSGDVENVAFIPRTGGSGSYPYYVYASGNNIFSSSADDGGSFSAVSCMTSVWSPYTRVHGDISYVYGGAGQHIIYIHARIEATTPFSTTYGSSGAVTTAYGLFRYVYNGVTENCSQILTYKGFGEDYQTDRLSVSGVSGSVYFGGIYLLKYNSNTGLLYDVKNGNDYVLPTTSDVPYASSSMHPDLHDILTFPSIHRIMVANDGGIYFNNYTFIDEDWDLFTNSWTAKNNGVHIAQTLSFSGAEDDVDLFSNTDIDHSVMFMNNGGTTFNTPSAGEAPATLIDKYDSDNVWWRNSAYNSCAVFSDDQTTTSYPVQCSVVQPDVTDFCDPDGSVPFGTHEFGLNSLFQDPNRPGHVFYGTNELNEFCFDEKKFHWKVRPAVILPSQITWGQNIVGMTFSQQNKNDTWLTLNGSGSSSYPPQILKYTGPDIDNSWVGHNENQWSIVTPPWSGLIPGTSPVYSATDKIWYPAIAASDWTSNKMWVLCSVWPNFPATDMPVKVLQYHNGTWTDISSGIPLDESPTALVYEKGSNDRLYLGTNRSIYLFDPGNGTWVDVSQGEAPHIMVSQMQINYTENTLRTGLKGRGVWKRDLVCPDDDNLVLSGVYSSNAFHEAAISIQASGYTQTSGDVKMRAGQYIDFLPGSAYTEVVSNSGNSLFAFIHGCSTSGNTWRHAIGDSLLTQLPNEFTIDETNAIKIYPNPTSGRITLECETPGPALVEVFDLYGRTIIKKTITESKTEFDLSEQARGIYLIKYTAGNKTQFFKMIKQ
jgi:hypothetical protein